MTDLYREGAAMILGVDPQYVTDQQRHNFKIAMFKTTYNMAFSNADFLFSMRDSFNIILEGHELDMSREEIEQELMDYARRREDMDVSDQW